MQRSLVIAASLTAAFALVGCGGGGGGNSPAQPVPVTVTPVPMPATTPPPVAGPNATVVSIQSVPSGLGVTIANGAASQSATTPVSTTPRVSNLQTLISIAPNNGGLAYTYAVDQHGAGSKTFLYNQAADTSGSIGLVSSSSSARKIGRAHV